MSNEVKFEVIDAPANARQTGKSAITQALKTPKF